MANMRDGLETWLDAECTMIANAMFGIDSMVEGKTSQFARMLAEGTSFLDMFQSTNSIIDSMLRNIDELGPYGNHIISKEMCQQLIREVESIKDTLPKKDDIQSFYMKGSPWLKIYSDLINLKMMVRIKGLEEFAKCQCGKSGD